VYGLPAAVIAVATPRVKTWFIIRRLFEPEEPSDVVPASGDGDAAPHVTVKVENSVIDGAVTKEVMLWDSCTFIMQSHVVLLIFVLAVDMASEGRKSNDTSEMT